MAEVVTRLVVAADGSLRTLDQFEKGMEGAGRATDYTSGAVTDFQRRIDAARAAMDRGNAVTLQSVQRKTAEERAWEKWSGTIDRTTRLRIRLEREAANASVAATNAVISGYASQEQALATLTALEQRHNAQLAASIAAHNREAAAIDNSTASMRMNTAAANSNNAARQGGGAFNTTNLMFQAQDIAVMTAMGQAPMMLAMQQGMQVGGIFHQIGSGRQIVQALGGAIMGLLNPLNLATIAVIGFGAAGVQALMGMGGDTEEATSALERHSEWLDVILAGYDAARDAAARAADEALKLPQGSVESDIGTRYQEALDAQAAAIEGLVAKQDELIDRREVLALGGGLFGDIISQTEGLATLALSADMTATEIDHLHTMATTLVNDNSLNDETKIWAQGVLEFANQIIAARANVEQFRGALDALPSEVQIRLSMQQEFGSAMGEIEGLYMDPRSRFDIARENLEFQAQRAQETATTYGQLVGAAENYERVLKSINAAEAEANKTAADRAAKTAQKPFDQWESANDNFQQRIDQLQLEIELMGQSTYEVTRQQAAFDLLNQAKEAGIPITDTVTSQINTMSAEYADLTVEMERMQQQAQLAVSINSTLASGFTNLFAGIIDGSKSAGEAIGDLLGSLGQLLINQAFMGLFGAGTSGGVGGFFSGLFMPNALGNVYSSPGLSAYSGQVVSSPTLFPFANGVGLMGEAGPEAIMPLRRGPDGKLGVAAQNGNGGGDIYITNQINVPPGTSPETAPAIAREVTKELRKQLPDAIETYNRNPLRRPA